MHKAASPQGGVAASSKNFAQLPKRTRRVVFLLSENHPGFAISGCFAMFLDRSATPPCGDARMGLPAARFQFIHNFIARRYSAVVLNGNQDRLAFGDDKSMFEMSRQSMIDCADGPAVAQKSFVSRACCSDRLDRDYKAFLKFGPAMPVEIVGNRGLLVNRSSDAVTT